MRSFVHLSTALLAALPVVYTQEPYLNWDQAYAAAEELVSSWTLAQAANVTIDGGNAPGWQAYVYSDGPLGLSGGHGVSGWVTPQTLAAAWDGKLVEEQYSRMAVEFRRKGYNMILGPSTGPSGRSVYGARNFENFGSDVYLNGHLFAFGVAAIQEQGLVSSAKHYLANEQETNRTADLAEDRSSSNLDDRTLHEVYLWPWIDGTHAGMGSVMCVMNRVNGSVGCENEYILTEVLKKQSGFRGFILPDATSPVNSTASVFAGLDWETRFDLDEIVAGVENGTFLEQIWRDKALRIVATSLMYNRPRDTYPDEEAVQYDVVREADSKEFIRSAGAQSIVLLKNVNKTLPLSVSTSVGIFGQDAANLGTGPAPPPNFRDFQGDTYASHLASGGGSGSAPVPHLVSPLDALTARSSVGAGFDYRYILSDNYTVEPPPSNGPGGFLATFGTITVSSYASLSEHCLVFINAFAKEGADRTDLAVLEGDQLVNDVARYCASTIVVINNAGVRLVDRFIENPNVTAVLNAGTLGQESGHSIMDVIFGDVNPSGKLVYTIAKNESDYNGEICSCCECDYTEGLYVDYKHFDQAGIEPRYEFGYGISYTTYGYDEPSVTKEPSASLAQYATGKVIQGGPEDLWDDLVTIEAAVTNTGDMAGAEIAQLYIGFPEASKSPIKQLRGFEKVSLEPGETKPISFTLNRRELSVWDTVAQKWRLYAGEYKVYLGASSRDIRGETSFELTVSEE